MVFLPPQREPQPGNPAPVPAPQAVLAGLSLLVKILRSGKQPVNANKNFATGKAFSGINVPPLLTPNKPGNHCHGCLLMSSQVGLYLPRLQGRNQVPLLCSTNPAAKGTASLERQGHLAGFCPRRSRTGQHRLPLLRQPCHRAHPPSYDRTFIHQMTLHVRFTPET